MGAEASTSVCQTARPRRLPAGSTALDLAKSIGKRLARDAVAATVDGVEVDLTAELTDGVEVAVLTGGSGPGRSVLCHSTAHVLAQAVLDSWPGAQYAIGPAIEDGFYYDFALPGGATFSDEDLERIEAGVREIMAEDQPFCARSTRSERRWSSSPASRSSARSSRVSGPRRTWRQRLREISHPTPRDGQRLRNPDGSGFVDLCCGPHVPSTGRRSDTSGCFAWPAPTGEGTSTARSCSGSTGRPGSRQQALSEHLTRMEEAEDAITVG